MAVVGPGAIGTTVAGALHRVGATPVLVGRTPRAGLRLETGDDVITVPGPVLTHPDQVRSPVDVVFLAVKATQTADAAVWLRRLCTADTVVCVLQNGIEQVGTVAPLVPDGAAVVPAVVWFPAVRGTDGSVRQLAEARLTLPDVSAARPVAALLEGSSCTVTITADFRTAAWQKLMQNAAAGLMALTTRRSGVFRRTDVVVLARTYLDECAAVARADGADVDDGLTARILDRFRQAPPDQGTSILVDRLAGHTLEWDARNGVVQRRGRALGVPTPVSDVLVPLLAATSDGPG